MAIIVNENTNVLVQGITGNQGTFHTRQMVAYGTNIVAGVSPGKGGKQVDGIPVYDTVRSATENHRIDTSVLFVPARLARGAAFEAMEAGIKVVVVITEHIPVHDEMEIVSFARASGVSIIGPNTFGIVSAGTCKIGVPSNSFFMPGPVGIVSRSGTLTYEVTANLTALGIGQSTVVGLGGDRVVGLSFVDVLKMFEEDKQTRAAVLIGEIGGNAEEEASEFIPKMTKPVVAYIAGKSAPPGKRMGHAGAIIERGKGTFQGKVSILKAAGVAVAELPMDVSRLIKECIKEAM